MVYKTNPTLKKFSPEEDLLGEEQVATEYELPRPSSRKIWGSILLVVVVIMAIWYLVPNFTPFKSFPALTYPWPSNQWQAVFLTNGQVYFGKIERVTWNAVVLKDIYYLQLVTRPLQRTIEGQASSTAQAQTTQEPTLIKLGNELHGPTDQIVISRSQIMFTEFLKTDGRVVQAINDYVKSLKETK
ncbi:MAG: hypothetical protein WCW02_01695 [Candidatus Buchananbacteria bacterium]